MSTPTAPNRVIHVPRRFAPEYWGGTESVIMHLCELQAAHGFRPEIHTSQALCAEAQGEFKGIPVSRYAYSYPFFGLSAEDRHSMDLKGGNLLSLPLYRALCRMQDVRVIHAQVMGRTGGIAMSAARKLGVPFVLTMQGNVFDVPADERATLLAPNQNKIEWGKLFGAIFKSRRVLEDADAVVCVGHSEYEVARKRLNHDRVYYLPNSVEPEVFEKGDGTAVRERLGIPRDAVVFGCISRIDPQKDQLTLVKAFGELAAERDDVHLLLAGPVTDPEYEKSLRDAIEGIASAGERVHWLPAVEPEGREHVDLMAALDVFTLASRHEPFGIVTLEAWSASKPVLTSKAGGLDFLVDHESDGLQFDTGDTKALVNCLKRFAEDPQLREAYGKAGREKVDQQYTWKVAYLRQEEVYEKALERVRS